MKWNTKSITLQTMGWCCRYRTKLLDTVEAVCIIYGTCSFVLPSVTRVNLKNEMLIKFYLLQKLYKLVQTCKNDKNNKRATLVSCSVRLWLKCLDSWTASVNVVTSRRCKKEKKHLQGVRRWMFPFSLVSLVNFTLFLFPQACLQTAAWRCFRGSWRGSATTRGKPSAPRSSGGFMCCSEPWNLRWAKPVEPLHRAETTPAFQSGWGNAASPQGPASLRCLLLIYSYRVCLCHHVKFCSPGDAFVCYSSLGITTSRKKPDRCVWDQKRGTRRVWSQGADGVIPSRDGLQFYTRFHQTENPVCYFDPFMFIYVGSCSGFSLFNLFFCFILNALNSLEKCVPSFPLIIIVTAVILTFWKQIMSHYYCYEKIKAFKDWCKYTKARFLVYSYRL